MTILQSSDSYRRFFTSPEIGFFKRSLVQLRVSHNEIRTVRVSLCCQAETLPPIYRSVIAVKKPIDISKWFRWKANSHKRMDGVRRILRSVADKSNGRYSVTITGVYTSGNHSAENLSGASQELFSKASQGLLLIISKEILEREVFCICI